MAYNHLNKYIYRVFKYIFFSLILYFNLPEIKSLTPYYSLFLEDFEKILVIYDSQISFYSTNLKEKTDNILEINDQKINSFNESEMISVKTFIENDHKEIYIIIKNYLYNFAYDGTLNSNFSIEIINDKPSIFIPYKIETVNSYDYAKFFIVFIDNDYNLNIYMYQHKLNNVDLNNIRNKTLNLSPKSISNSVSCQKMTKEDNEEVLTCFYEDEEENQNKRICAIIINIETLERYDSNSLIVKENKGASNIKSVVFNSGKKSFICYLDNENDIACLIFDIIKNLFEKEYKYLKNIEIIPPIFNIDYFSKTNEFMLSSHFSFEYFLFIILDENMFVIDSDYKSNFCYSNYSITKTCKKSKYPTIIRFYDSNTYKLNFFCQILENKGKTVTNKCKIKEVNETTLNITEKIIKKRINKNLEETINELDDIIKKIDPNKIYELLADNYLVKISPINFHDFEETPTYINFLKCEATLRKLNNIPNDYIITVAMIEIEKKDNKALNNQVEYALYYNDKRLDLSVCQKDEIEIVYAITNSSLLNIDLITKFSELGVDILNIKDDFFNDICYPFSENNSDMILEDRISKIYQNFSFCDDNCKYENINLNLSVITCKCSIKNTVETTIPPLRFDNIILDLLTNSSFGVVKCYKLVFNFKIKLNNIGFWIFTVLILLHILFIIHYCIYGINPIYKYIFNEMIKFNYYRDVDNPIKKKKKKLKTFRNNIYQINLIHVNGNITKQNSINSSSNTDVKSNSLNENQNKIINNQIIYRNDKSNKTFLRNISNSNKNILSIEYNKIDNIKYNKNDLNKNENDKKDIIKENDYKNEYFLIQINADNSENNEPWESNILLDNYDFENAIKYEKRNFLRIYYICLLSKENILNLLLIKSPLELKSIRLIVFIFIYSCDLALNTLFYFNDNISDKYNYNGDNLYLFTIFNNFFISFLSTFISFCLVNFLQFLTNSKESIETLFRDEEKKMRKDNKYTVSKSKKDEILLNIYKINNNLQIKIAVFIIIEFIIMLFFYYFVTAFCEVYKETQISWILDSFISFILSFPIEFLNAFLIALLYYISIKNKIKCLYQIAMVFYSIG